MAARKKSKPGKSGSAKRSNALPFLFQFLVIGLIGWFVYCGYSGHQRASHKTRKSAITESKTKPARANAPSAKRRAPQQSIIEEETPRKQAVSISSSEYSTHPDSNHPKIAMAAHPRKVKTGRKPKIVFVIDDIGYIDDFQNLLLPLGNKVTYSILPDLEFSRYFDSLSLKTGADVILHLPLQAQNGTDPGPGLIKSGMSDKEVLSIIDHDLASTPHFLGANNHMGSSASMDRRLMRVILSEFKRRGKFFLDSYTTKDSLIVDVAQELGVAVHRRDIFLDNEDNQKHIRFQIKLLADMAYAKGYAIAIGHYRYNTLKVLSEEIPRLEDSGYDIVGLSELY